MAEKYIVEGYEFDTKEEAVAAKKELEAVRYMAQKTEGCTPEAAYKIYNRLTEDNVFKTDIGYDYLRALEEYLLQNGMFDVPDDDAGAAAGDEEAAYGNTEEQTVAKDSINPEDIGFISTAKDDKPKTEPDYEIRLKKVRDKLKVSVFFNIVLAIAIAAMMYIASTSSNINIINYETKLQDKYASWAEELRQKEAELKDRENRINELEK